MGFGLTGALTGLAAGAGIVGGAKADRDEQKNDRRAQGKMEQASLRNEATYRGNRGLLMSGIEDFFKKKGWALPEFAPGYGTSRPLPGDAPLYPDYNVPQSDWTYQQTQPTPTPQPTTDVDPVATEGAPATGFQVAPDGQPVIFSKKPAPVTAYKNPESQPLYQDAELTKLLNPYGYL